MNWYRADIKNLLLRLFQSVIGYFVSLLLFLHIFCWYFLIYLFMKETCYVSVRNLSVSSSKHPNDCVHSYFFSWFGWYISKKSNQVLGMAVKLKNFVFPQNQDCKYQSMHISYSIWGTWYAIYRRILPIPIRKWLAGYFFPCSFLWNWAC